MDLNPNCVTLVPTKSDVEVAEDIRKRMAIAYKEPMEIFEEASQLGFLVGTVLRRDQFGRLVLDIKISKEF